MQKRIVIAAGCRTPIGVFGRSLKEIPAHILLGTCFRETMSRASLEFNKLDGAIAATCMHDPIALNVARVSMLLASLEEPQVTRHQNSHALLREDVSKSKALPVPAHTESQNCGSGLRAIISAAQKIKAGDGAIFLVGGTENMSRAPFQINRDTFGFRLGSKLIVDSLDAGLNDPLTGEKMGLIAENVVEKHGINRREQDKFAANSHCKAIEAIDSGKFESQIIPIHSKTGLFSEDEGPNRTLNAGTLAAYPAIFKKDGTITPGNACGINDGAASLLVLSLEKAEELGIQPEAEIFNYEDTGLHPSFMGEGPICAINKLAVKLGMSTPDFLKQVDAHEINEAFAGIVLAAEKVLNIPDERVNIYGGAIALGHPVGATGVILTVKAANILKDSGARNVLVSMCIGNGQGIALWVGKFEK